MREKVFRGTFELGATHTSRGILSAKGGSRSDTQTARCHGSSAYRHDGFGTRTDQGRSSNDTDHHDWANHRPGGGDFDFARAPGPQLRRGGLSNPDRIDWSVRRVAAAWTVGGGPDAGLLSHCERWKRPVRTCGPKGATNSLSRRHDRAEIQKGGDESTTTLRSTMWSRARDRRTKLATAGRARPLMMRYATSGCQLGQHHRPAAPRKAGAAVAANPARRAARGSVEALRRE
jgi:hypothetical protein